jgi:hypothetical protein
MQVWHLSITHRGWLIPSGTHALMLTSPPQSRWRSLRILAFFHLGIVLLAFFRKGIVDLSGTELGDTAKLAVTLLVNVGVV